MLIARIPAHLLIFLIAFLALPFAAKAATTTRPPIGGVFLRLIHLPRCERAGDQRLPGVMVCASS